MFKLLEIEREQDNRVAEIVYKGELFSSLVGRQGSAAVAWQRQHRGAAGRWGTPRCVLSLGARCLIANPR